MNYSISSWPVWLGLFTTIAILFSIIFKMKTKKAPKRLRSDVPIHRKPLFQIASGGVLIILIILFFI